ncbi:hypothetical protein IU487_22655 [Nocardia puris]|uniref:hypothetical protein n=1 Tax=Nocardia puris TaxID=208602 RepID=UPI00189320F6|nr:hypothetical protein [Nocardia puris]MBF6213821.1 hypothetical protein [Nocardia puris]
MTTGRERARAVASAAARAAGEREPARRWRAPTLGRPVTSPADAAALYRTHCAHSLPAYSPRAWMQAEYRSRAQILASRLAELSSNPLLTPGELFDAWRDAGAELRGLLDSLRRAGADHIEQEGGAA